MLEPISPLVQEAWAKMTEAQRAFLTERAGILEQDGEVLRETAEREALMQTRRYFRRIPRQDRA